MNVNTTYCPFTVIQQPSVRGAKDSVNRKTNVKRELSVPRRKQLASVEIPHALLSIRPLFTMCPVRTLAFCFTAVAGGAILLPPNCTAIGEALCSADGNCSAFGIYNDEIQLHGCAVTVPNLDWTIFARQGGGYAQLPGHVNVNESACVVHPNSGVAHSCAPPSATPSQVPSPVPRPSPEYQKIGSFDASTFESSIQWWGPARALIIMESIGCGYWGHAGQWIPAYDGHSYFRVRNLETGAVLANLSATIGFGFGSAFVDHNAGRFWVFGTPHDRCDHPVVNSSAGVWAWWSDAPDLSTWQGGLTDVAWSGPNTDVGRVYGSPPGLPPHR